MPIAVACNCGKQYSVADDMAGKRVRCGRCKAAIDVPDPSAASPIAFAQPSPPSASTPQLTPTPTPTPAVASAATPDPPRNIFAPLSKIVPGGWMLPWYYQFLSLCATFVVVVGVIYFGATVVVMANADFSLISIVGIGLPAFGVMLGTMMVAAWTYLAIDIGRQLRQANMRP